MIHGSLVLKLSSLASFLTGLMDLHELLTESFSLALSLVLTALFLAYSIYSIFT